MIQKNQPLLQVSDFETSATALRGTTGTIVPTQLLEGSMVPGPVGARKRDARSMCVWISKEDAWQITIVLMVFFT